MLLLLLSLLLLIFIIMDSFIFGQVVFAIFVFVVCLAQVKEVGSAALWGLSLATGK